MYNTLFYLTLTKNYWKLTNITIIKNFATKSMQKINRKKIRIVRLSQWISTGFPIISVQSTFFLLVVRMMGLVLQVSLTQDVRNFLKYI
mgnify:CR=1 FL=1